MPKKKKKNSTVQKEIIGDSVKTFLFGDDATKMKTDTVGEWAVLCCVCVVCVVVLFVCDDDSVESHRDNRWASDYYFARRRPTIYCLHSPHLKCQRERRAVQLSMYLIQIRRPCIWRNFMNQLSTFKY